MVQRTFDILEHINRSFGATHNVLAAKSDGIWVHTNAAVYVENSTAVSYGLMEMGLVKGDKIAVISNNRPEWNFLDMGMSAIGIVHVPIYPTISTDDFTYILHHAEPKLVFVSDKLIYEKIKPIADKLNAVNGVYSFNKIKGVKHWEEITELGREHTEHHDTLMALKVCVKPEDLSTLIYTSGTTGAPKGVMLSHKNLVSNVLLHIHNHSLGKEHRTLSFLPLSHIYERSLNYHFQYKGLCIYYAENMGTIMENIREVKPHIFSSVPRLLERVYSGIIGKGKDLPFFKKQIFFWAVNLGNIYKRNKENGWFYHMQLKLADKLVFKKWRAALGGNLQIVVSGGAALQPRISRIFGAAGIEILEGYGLTETSPVIAVSNYVTQEIMYGTVGPVLPGIELKFAKDGEILCKGPNVMMGYYKEPDLTREVLDKDGWFHTGDIGVLVENKYLKITDRKKEMFKLSSGKYISPQVVENKLKESFFIEQVMVIGENEKFASAIISPNFSFLHNWCSIHRIHFQDNKDLIQNPEVIERFQKEVHLINKSLGLTEQIKRFRLISEEWTQLTGELSPTLKLKRKYIYDKYSDIIEDIFKKSREDSLE
jgi:long-chain acyl-CoA synthetase